MPLRSGVLSMLKQISQLVYSVTELRGIDSVTFTVNGHRWGMSSMRDGLIKKYSRSFLKKQGTVCNGLAKCFTP